MSIHTFTVLRDVRMLIEEEFATTRKITTNGRLTRTIRHEALKATASKQEALRLFELTR